MGNIVEQSLTPHQDQMGLHGCVGGVKRIDKENSTDPHQPPKLLYYVEEWV